MFKNQKTQNLCLFFHYNFHDKFTLPSCSPNSQLPASQLPDSQPAISQPAASQQRASQLPMIVPLDCHRALRSDRPMIKVAPVLVSLDCHLVLGHRNVGRWNLRQAIGVCIILYRSGAIRFLPVGICVATLCCRGAIGIWVVGICVKSELVSFCIAVGPSDFWLSELVCRRAGGILAVEICIAAGPLKFVSLQVIGICIAA